MSALLSRLWQYRHDYLPMTLLVLAIGLLVVLGASMIYRGVSDLRELGGTRSDNVVFTVAQAEVEFLELQRTLLSPADRGGSAAEIRQTFDVLYSRMTTLQTAPVYRDKITEAGAAEDFAVIVRQIETLVPVIDGGDAVLMAGRPQIVATLNPLRPTLRSMASRVTQCVAEMDEAARAKIYGVFRDLALVVALLISSMGMLSWLIWRLFRFARGHARDLRQTSTRLATIVTTSQDAIVVTDGEDRMTEFNAAAEALFGYDRNEALGRKISALCNLSGIDGQQRRRRVQGRKKDGQPIPLEVTRGAESTQMGCIRVYVFRDISHRLAIEEDLRDSRDRARAGERAKARFLAVMSHEMRTPLNGILGIIDLLRAGFQDVRLRRYIDILENSGQTLLGHVNDVLDITQIEAAGVPLVQEPVDLDALSHEVLLSLESAARAKGVTLHRRVNLSGNAPVLGDRARLRQILTNLLDNAIKHTSEGEITLEISTAPPGAPPLVEFQVADTGVGIPPDQLERIFEDFVRLDMPDGSQAIGTGLGLGITRRLVRSMGGDIGVESEPGEGSLFWVRLPLAPAAPETAPAGKPMPVQGPATPQQVLVVEDNPVNRFILREMLVKDGHRVDEAQDGAEGVTRAAAHRYDLILMDIGMPVMDGYAATRAIRSGGGASADTRIVALTAHIYASETAECQSAGFDQVVTKPLTWDALRGLLRGEAPPPGPRPGTTRALLDTRALSVLRDTMGAGVTGLIADFQVEGAAVLACLDDPAAPDAEKTERVHALAGAAATLGAHRLHHALSEVEAQISEGVTPRDLHQIWNDTCAALAAQDFETLTA